MLAVSSTVTEWLLALAEREGVALDAWLRELPIRAEQLRGADQRIDWDVFSALCHRLQRLLGGPEPLARAAAALARERCRAAARDLPGGLDAVEPLYWVGQRWLAPALLPGVETRLETGRDGHLELEVALPERARPCPPLFVLLEALLRQTPRMVGAPEAQVRAEAGPHRARFRIAPRGEPRPGAPSPEQIGEKFAQLGSDYRSLVRYHRGERRLEQVHLSDGYEQITGYPVQQTGGRRWLEIVHPDDRQTLLDRAQLAPGVLRADEYRILTKSGETRWIRERSLYEDGGDEWIYWYSALQDVTDEIRARATRSRVQALLDNSSELIAIFFEDGGLAHLNPAGRALLGFGRDEAIAARKIFEVLAPEAEHGLRFDAVPQALQNGSWEGELELRALESGDAIATLATLFPLRGEPGWEREPLALMARDIRARKRAELALQDSEVRFRTLLENAFDMVAELDAAGRLLYVSPTIVEALGHTPEALFGGTRLELVHPDDHDIARTALQAQPSPARLRVPPHRLRHADGSWRWFESHIRRFRGLDGRERMIVTSRDVTERQSAAQLLRQSETLLRHAQKMEAVGRLAGGLAHDFNNLLTAITGHGELLLQGLAESDPLREEAREILRAAEQAASVTQQLLRSSRPRPIELRRVDLNGLVSNVDRMLRRVIGPGVELVTRFEGLTPPIHADPGQLEQLLLNLALNARDAMPDGGHLEVATGRVEIPSPGDPRHPGIPPGEWATLRVSDDGVGMDEMVLPLIFEPFFTTKGAEGGSGLGLFSVYGVVKQHGAHIRVSSEPGRSTSFTSYWPPAAAPVD